MFVHGIGPGLGQLKSAMAKFHNVLVHGGTDAMAPQQKTVLELISHIPERVLATL